MTEACRTYLGEGHASGILTVTHLWEQQHPSCLSTHDAECCIIAREWFSSMDVSLRDSDRYAGPVWLRERYAWGPNRWPLYWCHAVASSGLDCGALAALARHVFSSRGVQALPVQSVHRFPVHNIRHWVSTWEQAGVACEWVSGDLVYHETCAIRLQGQIRIWDPTDNCWMADSSYGYGSVVALRIVADDASVVWEGRELATNEWVSSDLTHQPVRVAD
jgi:hypothetical protein